MIESIIVALLSFAGTILGSIFGILTANKLTNYRIDRIEERLNNMDILDRRIYNLETHNEVQDERIEAIRQAVGRNTNDLKELK